MICISPVVPVQCELVVLEGREDAGVCTAIRKVLLYITRPLPYPVSCEGCCQEEGVSNRHVVGVPNPPPRMPCKGGNLPHMPGPKRLRLVTTAPAIFGINYLELVLNRVLRFYQGWLRCRHHLLSIKKTVEFTRFTPLLCRTLPGLQ